MNSTAPQPLPVIEAGLTERGEILLFSPILDAPPAAFHYDELRQRLTFLSADARVAGGPFIPTRIGLELLPGARLVKLYEIDGPEPAAVSLCSRVEALA